MLSRFFFADQSQLETPSEVEVEIFLFFYSTGDHRIEYLQNWGHFRYSKGINNSSISWWLTTCFR